MTVTIDAPTVTDPHIMVERVPGQLVLDVQVTPAPTRQVQQRIERRLLGVDGVSDVVADAMGGFRVSIANDLFDLDLVAEDVSKTVRLTATNEVPQIVRVNVRQNAQDGWWMIETDRRHHSPVLLDRLAAALHPPQFNAAVSSYYAGSYNILVWATAYWNQERVEAKVTEVINEFYSQS